MKLDSKRGAVVGYLPDERPTTGKLIVFALQQLLVMFPATILVAILTGFHISTTIFASGLATIIILFINKGTLPLYYGSSFSYITAIVSITGSSVAWEHGVAPDHLISQAQFGIVMSGFVSIIVGLIIKGFGAKKIERVLPPTITGSVALIIGLSLAGTALTDASGINTSFGDTASWTVALVTLIATVFFSVYLKGTLGQVSILLGIVVGYITSLAFNMVDFSAAFAGDLIQVPHFTLPTPNFAAVLALMPIAIATIPESTAHLYQLDIYVDHLASQKGKKSYNIKDKLWLNLVGDGIGDIVSASIGGPAGTNYGENLSTQSITRNFSSHVLGMAAIIAMVISFFSPVSNLIATIPSPVIGGATIYLFGVIAAQGISIMVSREVDLFDSRNLAIIAVVLIIGIGGSFGFDGGMIPFMGAKLPAIATASLVGIVMNLLLSIGRSDKGYKD